MAKGRTVSLDEADREIDRRIAGTDQARAAALAGLAGVRQAKQNILQREQIRLSLKLGPDHPRVAAVAAQIAANNNLRGEVALETERAKTEVPAPAAGAWLLYGYVRGADGKGVAGLTVGLFDAQGNWARGLGYVCTGAGGYFKLESGNVAAAKGAVQLRLLDSEGRCVYADKTPLAPAAGKVDYREIRLDGTQPACPPPPCGGDSAQEPETPAHGWVVQGRITGAGGQGLPGLTVAAYDKDLLFDDYLGSAETDADGRYRIVYRTRDFRLLFEKRPDLYLKISGKGQDVCYTTLHAIRREAGRDETIDVALPVAGRG